MKDKTITRKITQGLYVLTTNNGGCIVDAVNQISSGDNPLIAVSVMKKNYTCELLKKSKIFALSVISKNDDGEIINDFGYHSMKDYDKFKRKNLIDINNLKIYQKAIGYLICEVVNIIDADSHILFIGKLIMADKFNDEEAMSYGYFIEHKGDYIKVTTPNKTAWICTLCGYIYYGEEVPDDYKCPLCGASKEFFKKQA